MRRQIAVPAPSVESALNQMMALKEDLPNANIWLKYGSDNVIDTVCIIVVSIEIAELTPMEQIAVRMLEEYLLKAKKEARRDAVS